LNGALKHRRSLGEAYGIADVWSVTSFFKATSTGALGVGVVCIAEARKNALLLQTLGDVMLVIATFADVSRPDHALVAGRLTARGTDELDAAKTANIGHFEVDASIAAAAYLSGCRAGDL